MTFLPGKDYGTEIARLNAVVVDLTSAVVSLYGAVVQTAAHIDNPVLRAELTDKANEVSVALDEIVNSLKPPKKASS